MTGKTLPQTHIFEKQYNIILEKKNRIVDFRYIQTFICYIKKKEENPNS
jgi:hypothetical protein